MSLAVIRTPAVNLALLMFAFALYLAMSLLLSVHKLTPPDINNLYTYRCQLQAPTADHTLRIRNVVSNLSIDLARQLCHSDIMAKQGYQYIEISWPPAGQITAKSLLAQEYDFLLNRHHNLKGLLNDIDELYQEIIEYPLQPIFWWSKSAPPQLTPAFFQHKRIGVTSNTESHPYYLIPLKSLADAGIQLSDEQLVILPTPDTLLQAFAEGHVDMIMASAQLPSQLQAHQHDYPLYHSQQAWEVASSSWFASKKISDTPEILCEFVRANTVYAEVIKNYAKQATIYAQC